MMERGVYEAVISGVKYRIRKLDLISQANVMSRFGPMLVDLMTALNGGLPAPVADGDPAAALSDPATKMLVASIVNGIGKMSDDDRLFVLNACLSRVDREVGSGLGWAPVWSVSAKEPMVSDLDLLTVAILLKHVAEAHFGPFFGTST